MSTTAAEIRAAIARARARGIEPDPALTVMLRKIEAREDGLRAEVETLRAKVARVEALASEWDRGDLWLVRWHTHDTCSQRRASDDLRAALADQSAQDGLSRAGTTSVASGATGDVESREIGAQDEGGKA